MTLTRVDAFFSAISTHAFTEGDMTLTRVDAFFSAISTHAFTEGDCKFK